MKRSEDMSAEQRYSAWSTKELVHATTIEREDYRSDALEAMLEELDSRKMAEEDEEQERASGGDESFESDEPEPHQKLQNDGSFIHIKSAKFPILPGEDEELINEGTYGKALALYLEARLKERSYDVPFICCEDWGWWVEICGQPFTLGVCVYGASDLAETKELCVALNIESGMQWSWRRFKFVDTSEKIDQLFSDLQEIFVTDTEVRILGYPKEYPL